MTSVVRPFISRSSASCTARSLSLSSADVASSRISTGASLAMARAMARRWRWPPDNWLPLWPMGVSRPCGRPSAKSSKLALRSASRTASRGMSAPSVTLAAMLSLNSTTSWLTSANWRRSARIFQSRSGTPSRLMWPELGSMKRGSKLTSVVLPAPEGPTRATVSPARTCSVSASTAGALSSR